MAAPITLSYWRPAVPMSSIPPPTFPPLNSRSRPSASAPPAMDSNNPHFMASFADTNMADVPTTSPIAVGPHMSGAQSFPLRAADPGYPPYYAHQFAHPPAGPMPYHGNGPTGGFANGYSMPPTGAASAMYSRFELIGNLLATDSPDFEYNAEVDAVLHPGKCMECVQFCAHLFLPGNATKYLRATRAHGDAAMAPLHAEIDRLTKNARITARNADELKDALQSQQQLAASLVEQRDRARQDHNEVLMEHRTLMQRLRELEQQHEAAPRRRPQSPVRPARRHSPPRSGTRFGTPYERPGPRHTAQPSGRHLHARAPAILEPDSEGDVIMTSMPTNVRNRFVRMHPDPSRYTNSRPCTAADYRWKANSGAEMIGLPRTRASTPYLPNDMGLGWYHLENGAPTTDKVYRRIGLIFRNRKEEAWLATARSAFDLRRLIKPLPEVVDHFIRLYNLRKSVWAIINKGIANGSDLSIVSPRCHLQTNGYAGLYTPDIDLWAVIHTATDIDSRALSMMTGQTTTVAGLKKMFKDAICSNNFFELAPAELAQGKYELPCLAHYDGPLDMNVIVEWLCDSIGMTPFMVHTHFRPFLRRTFESSLDEHHQEFSNACLLANEAVAPPPNDSLADFPESHDWTPNRGPRGRLCRPNTSSTSANASSVLSAGSASSAPPSSVSSPDDAVMIDSGGTAANALLVPPQSTTA